MKMKALFLTTFVSLFLCKPFLVADSWDDWKDRIGDEVKKWQCTSKAAFLARSYTSKKHRSKEAARSEAINKCVDHGEDPFWCKADVKCEKVWP